MATYVFREELEQSRLEWRLRRLMKIHLVVNLDVLSLESGCSKDDIRSILYTLMQRREVERLRPVNYEKDNMDFFCLRVQQRQARVDMSRNRWFKGLKNVARRLFDEVDDNIEHHVWFINKKQK